MGSILGRSPSVNSLPRLKSKASLAVSVSSSGVYAGRFSAQNLTSPPPSQAEVGWLAGPILSSAVPKSPPCCPVCSPVLPGSHSPTQDLARAAHPREAAPAASSARSPVNVPCPTSAHHEHRDKKRRALNTGIRGSERLAPGGTVGSVP